MAEKRLKEIWRWMGIVLDRTEAQLNFGNALMSSPAGTVIAKNERKSGKKTDDDKSRLELGFFLVFRPQLKFFL